MISDCWLPGSRRLASSSTRKMNRYMTSDSQIPSDEEDLWEAFFPVENVVRKMAKKWEKEEKWSKNNQGSVGEAGLGRSRGEVYFDTPPFSYFFMRWRQPYQHHCHLNENKSILDCISSTQLTVKISPLSNGAHLLFSQRQTRENSSVQSKKWPTPVQPIRPSHWRRRPRGPSPRTSWPSASSSGRPGKNRRRLRNRESIRCCRRRERETSSSPVPCRMWTMSPTWATSSDAYWVRTRSRGIVVCGDIIRCLFVERMSMARPRRPRRWRREWRRGRFAINTIGSMMRCTNGSILTSMCSDGPARNIRRR